jgi:hypothetical protein
LARQNFGIFSRGPGDFFGNPKKMKKKLARGRNSGFSNAQKTRA